MANVIKNENNTKTMIITGQNNRYKMKEVMNCGMKPEKVVREKMKNVDEELLLGGDKQIAMINKMYIGCDDANIANVNKDIAKCGCLLGGSFLEYFTNPDVPWIHMDVASNTFIKHIPTSYGINLLYYFITRLYQV